MKTSKRSAANEGSGELIRMFGIPHLGNFISNRRGFVSFPNYPRCHEEEENHREKTREKRRERKDEREKTTGTTEKTDWDERVGTV